MLGYIVSTTASKLIWPIADLFSHTKSAQPPSSQPFQAVRKISELHDYFRAQDLSVAASLPQDDRAPGYCYVCSRGVYFKVIRSTDGSPVNMRESLRCLRCRLTNRWRSSIHLFEFLGKSNLDQRIYITEALTPISYLLGKKYKNLTFSEYLSDVGLGSRKKIYGRSVQCEDITRLTFPSGNFDTILCFDVLEHIPDYRKALAEFHRVLGRNGRLILTAPFSFQQETVVRARIDVDGEIRHLCEPCYHDDPLSEQGILAYYDFGMELLDELNQAGFGENYVVCYESNEWGYFGKNVAFVSQKL